MFVGHYAVSFALKAIDKKTSLGVLFLAVQFVDLLFFPLALLGIEKFTIIENYTESTHFKLDFMPYSHSLMAVLLWSFAFYLIFYTLRKKQNPKTRYSVAIIAFAILSHWWLDLIVHTPDLPLLLDNSYLVGLGLWNNALLTYVTEAAILLVGLFIYLRATYQAGVKRSFTSRYAMVIFVILLLAINVLNIFGPLSIEETNLSAALSAIVAYCLFAFIAFWLDKKRLAH